jgi:hypothetical protein
MHRGKMGANMRLSAKPLIPHSEWRSPNTDDSEKCDNLSLR